MLLAVVSYGKFVNCTHLIIRLYTLELGVCVGFFNHLHASEYVSQCHIVFHGRTLFVVKFKHFDL